MTELKVDREKCDSCGICALECPARIIDLVGQERRPAWVENGEERCIVCGHCVAVCPLAAIGLDSMKPEDCVAVRRSLLPSADQAEHLMKSRRSIRVYKEQPVPRETLERLIDIARYAPSGHNSQPVRWLAIQDSREVRRLAGVVADWMRMSISGNPRLAELLHFDFLVADWDRGIDRIMRGAPHAILAHAPADHPTAPQAATIALTYLEVAAHALDLGACWAGFLQACATFHPPMKGALGLPDGHVSLGAMMIGYPEHRFARIPVRKEAETIWR
jgi:nitroreductase/NAD-dependent dihydropyrimidine dehydrogenase PreA subunit